MTRQTRLLVILAVMTSVGVLSLSFVANQYRKALPPHVVASHAEADATRLIEGFLAARRAVRAVDARYPGGARSHAEALEQLRSERSNAFSAHGMTIQDYVAVRTAWRAARSGAPVADPALAAVLRTKPAALTDAALPAELEDLDDTLN